MKKIIAGVSIIAGLVLLYIGYFYASHTAGSLPAYFPGHEVGSTHVHTKHSIAAFIVGILCFVYAWFQTGPKEIKS